MEDEFRKRVEWLWAMLENPQCRCMELDLVYPNICRACKQFLLKELICEDIRNDDGEGLRKIIQDRQKKEPV